MVPGGICSLYRILLQTFTRTRRAGRKRLSPSTRNGLILYPIGVISQGNHGIVNLVGKAPRRDAKILIEIQWGVGVPLDSNGYEGRRLARDEKAGILGSRGCKEVVWLFGLTVLDAVW